VQCLRRFGVVVAERLVELGVFLRLHLPRLPQPDRLTAVQRLLFDLLRLGLPFPFFVFHIHHDGMFQEVRELLHQRAQLPFIEEVLGIFLEMQDHVGATGRLVERFDRVLPLTVRDPFRAFAARPGSAGAHSHFVRDHEGGVEADTELADQSGGRVRVVLLLHRFEEGLGARFRHGAEVVDHLGPTHADAVIRDGQRPRLFVGRQLDLPILVVFEGGLVIERIELHLVDGVRRVRDQLAQEDLAVGIERVGDEVEQLP
jgi:hypothetical protein